VVEVRSCSDYRQGTGQGERVRQRRREGFQGVEEVGRRRQGRGVGQGGVAGKGGRAGNGG
jgi:hypothetical protein